MKLDCLPKWRTIFSYHGKPHTQKSKGHNTVGLSTNPSSHEDASRNPQVLTTQVELLPPEPAASSAIGPTASTAQPESLTLHNYVTPREEPEAVITQSLWDRAYEGLRHKDEQLVDKYEELLSRELPPRTSTQRLEKTNEQIDNTNLENRQEQLKTIIGNGLRRMDEGKTKYIIFGHEFVPRDQIAQAARFVQGMRTLVDEAVKVSPEASLAWAGVCTILPILTNPVAAEEANRDGFTYVASRMRFYVELEHLLWPAGLRLATELRREFGAHLVDLYQHILEFQVRTVLRFYQTRLARLGDDVVKHEVWKGMLSKIQELEMIFDNDLKKINDSSSRMELESLNKKADKFLVDMSSILSALMETQDKPANSSFNNYGSGHQLNTSGGTQNNNMGSGNQFTETTFSAPVQFGSKMS
ncbi:hypothetical protein FOPG_16910 [Fusarium oxysporum f. sp. conglutinans race 2 54008]|nr:hypothetical protein FOPG_16910 [Fusarium oxysporum f. sp. conglutinans race 2 54008]KAF6530546.1 hypothetical protein HZS61_001858 [Fusarium oxysporum f. sp. conglutinans]KAG6991675.1 hypothetical protein FocnCong_v017588 [Fusarium oxysporum f. sp. conglutinans]KAI8417509.1 hypothetical protein FOFC_00064 [Fusarium oxysporum]